MRRSVSPTASTARIARSAFSQAILAMSALGEAALQQFRDQMREAADVLQAQRLRAAEEVGADADVVDPGGLDEIDDMVGDLRKRRLRRGAVAGLDLLQLRFRVARQRRLAVAVARALEPIAQRLADEAGHEGRHDDAAVRLQPLQHVVRRIARVVAQRKGVGVRKEHGRFADVQQHAQAGVAHMRAVDDHAKPVALADHGAAEGVETVVARRVGGGIDPVERLVMAGDQHSRAGGAPDAQRRQRIFEADAALDDDERGDLAGLARALEVRRRAGGVEHVGVSLLDAQNGVDLFERRARRVGRARRLERRPELRADETVAQARNVGVAALVDARSGRRRTRRLWRSRPGG